MMSVICLGICGLIVGLCTADVQPNESRTTFITTSEPRVDPVEDDQKEGGTQPATTGQLEPTWKNDSSTLVTKAISSEEANAIQHETQTDEDQPMTAPEPLPTRTNDTSNPGRVLQREERWPGRGRGRGRGHGRGKN